MKKNLLKSLLVLSVALSIFGCNSDKKNEPKKNKTTALTSVAKIAWAASALENPQVKVFNEFGEPITNAKVLVGMAPEVPFQGNLFLSDSSGAALISKEWKVAAPVSIEADGYVRLTLLNQQPGDITVRLTPLHLPQAVELTGEVTQLPINNGDKLVDFGLVMPALGRSDLLNFNINSVISPYSDVLTIAGQQNAIPTNLSLPAQKENFIFNLSVAKPVYRMKVSTLGPKRFYVASGRFVFKTVIEEVRKGVPFYQQLNSFMISGGSVRDVTLVNETTHLDIPGNELQFNETLQVNSTLGNEDEITLLIAASLVADTMIPT
ncbi:MAG: hypothetical protein H7061_08785, partial [Bdellovibrionaceae bacterium]|nr:hypothetical protein [Bdellovibrio sp.]